MRHNFNYYLEIAWKDSVRARSTLLSIATVFAGIALLLLVLTGLKQGLVQRLHDDLMKSPTATTGNWFATSKSNALDSSSEKRLLAQLPPGAKLIPDISKVLKITSPFGTSDAVTVQATVPNDPALLFYGASISDIALTPEMVVSPQLARELGISSDMLRSQGFQAKLSISREEREGKNERTTVELDVSVKWIVGSETSKAKNAYLSRIILEQIEDFMEGQAVLERGWPGKSIDDSLGFQGYLSFTKQPYSADDLLRFHRRGFQAIDLAATDQPADRTQWIQLYGLLYPHNLYVYFVTSGSQSTELDVYSRHNVEEVEAITNCDDVMLYWSIPKTARIQDRDHTVIGIGGSMRWLKNHFVESLVRMNGMEMKRVMFVRSTEAPVALLPLSADQSVRMTTIPTPPSIQGLGELGWLRLTDSIVAWTSSLFAADDDQWRASTIRGTIADVEHLVESHQIPLAIVPPTLLSAIHQSEQGMLVFDSANQNFQRVNTANHYYSGRFCASVLDDVPLIDKKLQSLGYSTVSSRLRVLEMQSYSGTLDLLVTVLQILAIVLGIVISTVLFGEITQRKQTAVGVMRIMGMPSTGVVIFVLLRAIIVASLGWTLASVMAVLMTITLPRIADAPCVIDWHDYAMVLLGSISCAGIGIAYSAYHAAFVLSPMDAVRNGKVQ